MRFVDIINKKKYGGQLSEEEIAGWIDGYVSGEIPDYQVSALLMAILFQGMTQEEILQLTMKMMHSGDVVDLSSIEGIKVDKHSTGGVGDKTTLVLGPLTAACGVKMAKMSGRGLGFTGGTIDKLESIRGFRTDLPRDAFIRQVNEIGIAVIGQSGNLVPADKKLYALRDVTGTVDSIPLIASSIMSKKLAAGSDVIVLDVKYGSGAFMKTPEEAVQLAQTMIDIGTGAGRKVRAVISSMEAPLGRAVGNALEVREAVETLAGRGPSDLKELCMTAGALILQEAGICRDTQEARQMLKEKTEDGSALEKLAQMVRAQGGDDEMIYDPALLPQAPAQTVITAEQSGWVTGISAMQIGRLAMQLGAGRARKDDVILPDVGIVLQVKPGSRVKAGDPLCIAYHRETPDAQWQKECREAFMIGQEAVKEPQLIYRII
jgi:pyrimidine-nucleoside phosphorylase